MKPLSEKQKAALLWVSPGSGRRWHGDRDGLTDPAAVTLKSLVDKGLAKKTGGNGWPAFYTLTPEGAALRDAIRKGA